MASSSEAVFKKSLVSWGKLEVQLSESSRRVLANMGFKKMTPVQSSVIPLMLTNKDVAVEAMTGSGKTLAFVLPVIEMLQKKLPGCHGNETHSVGAVVISPTRELAGQIAQVFRPFCEDCGLVLACYTGGKNVEGDIEDINSKGAHIVVATPGQLQEMLHQRRCRLAQLVRSLEVLVLDEADRLLDMGFNDSLNDILSYLPKQRRTGLFSATQTRQLQDLVRAGLRNPLFVKVKEKGPVQQQQQQQQQSTPSQLQNYYAVVPAAMKVTCLVEFLRAHKDQKVMVFFATCSGVDYHHSILLHLVGGSTILALHGKMKGKRQSVFDSFAKMDSGVLLCTDVMARGVDFPSVDWVLQFDPPSTSSVFVHRCGRTARIGHRGRALLLLLANEEPFVEFLRIRQNACLQAWDGEWTLGSVVPKIRKMAAWDRAVYEKGNASFVSFIQAYGKNECSLLFQLKELQVGELAEGMGLLRLPRMPELKGKKLSGFTHSGLDLNTIKYSDKHREKQHQVSLLAKRARAEEETASTSMEGPNEGKRRKSEQTRPVRRAARKSRTSALSAKDMKELSEGARLVKKFRRGKLTKEEFDAGLDKL